MSPNDADEVKQACSALTRRPLPEQNGPKPADRLFFAIFPDASVAVRIGELAQYLRREHGLTGKPLRTERFHITLFHLGDYPGLPQGIVTAAVEAAATVALPAFEVKLDRALSFSTRERNRPFVLGGNDGVAALTAFRRALAAALDKAGLGDCAEPQYRPHVTLLYDDALVTEQPVEAVAWTVREFVLVHSLLGRAVYIPLARWLLSV
jgi:2'-5' RNA ligase